MAEDFIDVQGTGQKLDTRSLVQTESLEEVHREVTVTGSPTNPDAVQEVDLYNKAAVVMDAEHYRIHQGEGYTASGKISVAQAGGEFFILLDNTNGTYPHFRWLEIIASAAPMDVYFYEAATTSANGTPVGAMNNNRNSTNTSVLSVYTEPTVSDNGLELNYHLLAGTKQSGGHGDAIPTEWIMKPTTKYLLRIVNNATGAGADDASFHMFWYEGSA